MQRFDVTGEPHWDLAREGIARLRMLPDSVAESEVESHLRSILSHLFPGLRYPDIATQYPSGDGPIDVYCRNVVFETKRQGKKDDARIKPDGSTETPEEQAVRYLDALTRQRALFDSGGIVWRACVTDGKEWSFYNYNPDFDSPSAQRLTLDKELWLDAPERDEELLGYLYQFVDRTTKLAPPTDNEIWVENLAGQYIALAAGCDQSAAYDVKRALWRDVLRGAYLTPPGDSAAERDLFARHTMLVVVARAVAETIRPAEQQSGGREIRQIVLTEGFAAWVLDAADADGEALLNDTVTEIDRYEWRAQNRDALKDLYHAVIPRNIRHDFGEYYTPDWLARAVCEEVMDAEWRREVIEMAVAGQSQGPAVLDPSCGSGTFLYHATQLLLEDARKHPELANSPQAQVEIVNALVAGIDLHPVAVELAKTTKILAFSDLAVYASSQDTAEVYLGDSLQWETRRNRALFELGDLVAVPTDDPDAPLRLPRNFLLSDHFLPRLRQIFDYAGRPEYPSIEDDLAAVLGLNTGAERTAIVETYRRFRQYISGGRNHVWQWYISNLVQPYRLTQQPASRMVGNPPWVVYNAMTVERQDAFRQQAQDRKLWASANLATQNDIAATFAATCVDYYLKPDGKFGFVLPYAALEARHWEAFRSGVWSLPETSGRQPTLIDLSKGGWDLMGLNSPPFPQANSSVIFGTKLGAGRRRLQLQAVPLSGIQEISNSERVNPKMPWDEVSPKLTFTPRLAHLTKSSEAYVNAFRNGATLFPQPLVVFEQPLSRALGKVYFRTNTGREAWAGSSRNGQVEERFVKPALFSRLLLPFGATGQSHIIAPFTQDGRRLETGLPQGDDAADFRLYWDNADRDWRRLSGPRPPHTLLDQVDYQGKLSSQLGKPEPSKVVYQRSGSWLISSVVPAQIIADGTLNWYASDDENELHYLAAIFNAPGLAEFFKEYCRASDRHFQMGPVENLPIPRFDPKNEHHASLSAQSGLAHQRVTAMVAERQAGRRRINRNDVLRDRDMQPILDSIDQSARAILPDYCSAAANL